MSGEPQLYRVNPENRESERIEEVEFSRLGLQERRDIQEWVAANPGILGDDLLIIGKEFSGFDRTDEKLDLLAVDWDGRLVIIELKRDDTGADVHWQAIKYASYFGRAATEEIVGLAAKYLGENQDEATVRLMQHLGADDLNALNNGQRIILASHRFAPEVITAAVWLNQQGQNEDLVTCIKLIPYWDARTGSLYVQASTIIPVPGVDDYLVGIGQGMPPERANSSSFGAKLAATFARNRNDEVTAFLRKVGVLATDGLAEGIKPDMISKWANGNPYFRYYHFWYRRRWPWSNHGVSHRIQLYRQGDTNSWHTLVAFKHWEGIAQILEGQVHPNQQSANNAEIYVDLGVQDFSDAFAEQVAATLRKFIETITHVVDELAYSDNDDAA